MLFTTHAHTCECNQGKNLLPSSSHQSFCWIFWGLIFDWWWTWEVSRKKKKLWTHDAFIQWGEIHFKDEIIWFFPAFWLKIVKKVSNKTGQCNFLGQRDRSSLIVQGHRDSRTSSKSCHGLGRDAGKSLFFPMISYCRSSFPVLGHPHPVLNILSCFRTSFLLL